MEGHDEDISRKEILKRNLVPGECSSNGEIYLRLFKRGQKMANEKGLILADTKYEFGIIAGRQGN